MAVASVSAASTSVSDILSWAYSGFIDILGGGHQQKDFQEVIILIKQFIYVLLL